MFVALEGRVADAWDLACVAHNREWRKPGVPYIQHPWDVATAVCLHGKSAMIVALLHDVLENCPDVRVIASYRGAPIYLDLSRGANLYTRCELTEAELAALRALTRTPGEPYRDYRKRALANPLARVVKRADAEDNLKEMPADKESLRKRYKQTLWDADVLDRTDFERAHPKP